MASSKPFADTLPDGRRILLFNPPPERNVLTIAVAAPGEGFFSRLFRLRSGASPCRFRRSPQWSYPSAIIHEDALYAAYTVSKEDAALSVVPLDCLC